MYDKPHCQYASNNSECNYEPTRKCDRCGKLICLQHSHEYHSPNSGAGYAVFNGIYCPDCVTQVAKEHDDKVKKDNFGNNACSCANCGCQTCSSICSSI